MTAPKELYRSACAVYHRMLGLYFATKAWQKGADCVSIEFNTLRKALSVDSLRSERLRWFTEDIADWFPETITKNGTYGTVYLHLFRNKAAVEASKMFRGRSMSGYFTPQCETLGIGNDELPKDNYELHSLLTTMAFGLPKAKERHPASNEDAK